MKETLRGSTVETDDDPLENITAAEAIEILVDSYRSSEYCRAANEKIEEMFKVVSVFVHLLSKKVCLI